jgi:SAM-dependent methyltransferase
VKIQTTATEGCEKVKLSCRFCQSPLEQTFVDLGVSPLANTYLKAAQLQEAETFYPLHAYLCHSCFLVQLEELGRPGEIFSDYSYFSSYAESWLKHAEEFAQMAIERFGLGNASRVIEVGSNDGYLLKFFQAAGIPVLGIEPAGNVAAVAREKGLDTLVRFFNGELAVELADKELTADLLVGNNVLAHVPALNDFVGGLKRILKDDGVICLEFPHLLSLIEELQFDTIYHEHYSYFSLTTVMKIFAAYGLQIFDVDLLETHGGSLRIYAGHVENENNRPEKRLQELLAREEAAGIKKAAFYAEFAPRVEAKKRAILREIIALKEEGALIAAYGAPAKGNTLLNYCGIGRDLIAYTVDRNPHKQGLYLPGSRIPIEDPEVIWETKPDYLLILPWNLREEIAEQMAGIRQWGGKFMVLSPEISLF